MNVICKVFGHQPPTCSRTSGGCYAFISDMGEDGTGRKHGMVYGECPRCGKEYRVCNVHQHRQDYKSEENQKELAKWAGLLSEHALKHGYGKIPAMKIKKLLTA